MNLSLLLIVLLPLIQASIDYSDSVTCIRPIRVIRVPHPHATSQTPSTNATQPPLPQPTPAQRCRFSATRTARGLKLACQCRHGRSEIAAEIIEGISPTCLRSCLPSTTLSTTCESGDHRSFTQQAKALRDSCCERCAGLPDGDTCVRPGPYSAPFRSPLVGCVVSFPVQPYGEQFACSCDGSVVVASPIMYAGVEQACLMRCARRRLGSVCVPDAGRRDLVDGMLDVFAECCEVCRGVALDAGLACGVRA